MEEEIRATYGTTRELKLSLTNSEGNSRTITLKNPKTDSTALKTAVDNFSNLVFDSATNIITVNGEQPISMTVDVIETTRSNVGNYGQTIPLYVVPSIIDTGAGGTFTAQAYNWTASTLINVQGDTANVNATFDTDTGLITVTATETPEDTTHVYIEIPQQQVAVIQVV